MFQGRNLLLLPIVMAVIKGINCNNVVLNEMCDFDHTDNIDNLTNYQPRMCMARDRQEMSDLDGIHLRILHSATVGYRHVNVTLNSKCLKK